MSERELERSLLDHLRLLILELGKGFAFVGSQYPLEVGGQDYYLDLLFYHLRGHLRHLPNRPTGRPRRSQCVRRPGQASRCR
jgi:predicted nuclease of restriction endonuclease-like (RecB) superfamily